MNAVRLLTRLVALALPIRIRERYREEWLADLAGAGGAGVSRWGVFVGAVSMTVRTDRDDPAVTGIPVAVETVRRARWAAAFLGSALVLAIGAFVFMVGDVAGSLGEGSPHALTFTVPALIAGLLFVGMVQAARALRIGVRVYGGQRMVRMIMGAAAAAVTLAVVSLLPLFGLLLSVGVITVVLFLAAGGPRGQPPQRPLGAGSRVGLSLGFSALTLGLVVLGVLHTLVWNPIAKVPGLGLAEIYAAMGAAQEPTGIAVVAAWGGASALAALAFPVCCALRRFAGPRSTRRIVVAGSMLVAGTTLSHWIAGFATGMSLADTFATTGADAAIGGPLLSLVGLLAVVVALFAGFVPARWSRPRVDEARSAA